MVVFRAISEERTECCQKLRDPDDNRGQVFFDGGVGGVKDGDGVENDGVDAGPLLEEHQAQGDEQRSKHGSLEHRIQLRIFAIVAVRLVDTVHIFADERKLFAGKFKKS